MDAFGKPPVSPCIYVTTKVFEMIANCLTIRGTSLAGSRPQTQQGASLIMVMLILIVVSVLGVGSAQISLMSERGARNERDLQVAWQSAEAALNDAEIEMFPNGGGIRKDEFAKATSFAAGCGTAGNSVGLCALNLTGKPAWLTANLEAAGTNTVKFGDFTTRTFQAGGAGIQPAQAPRYVVEIIPDPASPNKANPSSVYRVTAIGFGPRTDIQVVLQMMYRI
jgi:type IV pilus assembly protein PilX